MALHNCNLIRSDTGDWPSCAIFPGKRINQNSGCLAWVLKSQGAARTRLTCGRCVMPVACVLFSSGRQHAHRR